MTTEHIALSCRRKTELPRHPNPEARLEHCEECGHEVWVSPAAYADAQEVVKLRAAVTIIHIVCRSCAIIGAKLGAGVHKGHNVIESERRNL